MDETACLFFLNPPPLAPLAEACLRFTSKVAMRDAEAVFLETGKTRLLYSGEGLAARLQALATRFRLKPRITFAADAPTALALARFKESRPGLLPLEALADY